MWTKGWNIILHYRSSSKDAMSLVNNFNSKRADSAFAIKADLDDPKEVEKLVADTLKCYGSLDALINNASTFFQLLYLKLMIKTGKRLSIEFKSTNLFNCWIS